MNENNKIKTDKKALEITRHSPAATIPIAKIELCATSISWSCDSLLKVSIMLSRGFEADNSARASGTALRITGSPY